jgi:hypothetical protein
LRTGVTNSQTELAGGVWPGADDGVSRRLSEIEATLDIQPFATDMGEYFTLAGARAAQDNGWDPEAEDARRALRFAVGWIVRWEAFRSGYPSERWAEWQSRIEPPVAGDRTTPQILSASADVVQDGLGNRHWLVRAQIANIPEKGRGDWGSDISQCFADAAGEFDGDLRPRRIGLYGRTGWVGIELSPGSDPDVTAATLRRMVELADRRYGERRSEREAREERRCALDRSWHELVAEAAPTVLAVAEVRWEVHHYGERYFVVLTRADPSAAQLELLLVADILRSRGGLLAGAGMRHDRLEIDSTRFSDQAASEVREALAAASQEVIRRRELLRVENEQYRVFTMRLRAEFGLPEGHAGER